MSGELRSPSPSKRRMRPRKGTWKPSPRKKRVRGVSMVLYRPQTCLLMCRVCLSTSLSNVYLLWVSSNNGHVCLSVHNCLHLFTQCHDCRLSFHDCLLSLVIMSNIVFRVVCRNVLFHMCLWLSISKRRVHKMCLLLSIGYRHVYLLCLSID